MAIPPLHMCVAVPCHVSLATSEPRIGGQKRRLTEAIPHPAVNIISLRGQRLFHQVEHEWREVNNSATPERRRPSVLYVYLLQCILNRHLDRFSKTLLLLCRCKVLLQAKQLFCFHHHQKKKKKKRPPLHFDTTALSKVSGFYRCLSVLPRQPPVTPYKISGIDRDPLQKKNCNDNHLAICLLI